KDIHSIVPAITISRVCVVPVIVSAFESLAEVMLVLVAIDIRIIAVAAAAVDRRAAIAAASAISAIVHALVIALAISVFDRPAKHIGLTLIVVVVTAVAICAIASLFGLSDSLLAFLVSLLLLFDPILFVCPSAIALSVRIDAAEGKDAKSESRG